MKTLPDMLWDLEQSWAKPNNPYIRMCTLAQNIQTLQTRYLQSTGEIERGDTFAFEITRDIDMSLCAIFGQILLICKEMDKDPYELWDAYIDTIGTK